MKFHFQDVKPSGPWADTPLELWNQWQWHMKQSLKSEEKFRLWFQLTENESLAFSAHSLFAIRTTPYYALLADSKKAMDPLRLIQVPTQREFTKGAQAMLDPLGEDANTSSPRLVHRYPDRVLFLVTDTCSVYCRFCTRKRFTGKGHSFIKNSDYDQALSYIKNHQGIREVILSGGDPLTLSDFQLECVLSDLRSIEHIEILRIGSRMPVVNPFRLTTDLAQMLRTYAPVFLMSHFNHPRELTAPAAQGLSHMVDNGIPVFNQMVLLNGVNNHPALVQALSRRLLYLRVKPYYMFQCDPSEGTDHFRTSIEDSENIQRELWGTLSGLAMPNLSLDIPDGGGKVPLVPNFEVSKTRNERTYKGWDGVQAKYVNPPTQNGLKPTDVDLYIKEWEDLKSAKSSTRFVTSPTELLTPSTSLI